MIPAALATQVVDAYRELRRLQHRAWLDEQPNARVDFEQGSSQADSAGSYGNFYLLPLRRNSQK